MSRRVVLVAMLIAAVATLVGTSRSIRFAAAQPSGHAGHADGAPDRAGEAPHRRMQATYDEIDRVIGQGLGAGLAFAADQHGYPGPLHVLELKDRLALTPGQEARIIALRDAMFAESRPKSARLLDAESRLRRLFADGAADEALVRAAVADVERARTEVRLVHLLAHLRTRTLLTNDQRRLYHDARWGP